MTVQATFLRDLQGFSGTAKLWKLSEPVDSERNGEAVSYVITSAAFTTDHGPETYIFPATSGGDVTSWGEMPGSFEGALDHERAIKNAGWEVVYA